MDWWLFAFLPIVAFLYAAVGHGGASGYLALMAILELSPDLMKPTALLLNLVVAGIAFYQFYKKGFFSWKLFYPFALTSVPAAFIGGLITLNTSLYKQILAVLLLFAVARMLGFIGKGKGIETSSHNMYLALVLGASIGFFSGLIGIGGGIILSPVILLLGWANVKQTAAISALFIWINSLAGFSGLMLGGIELHQHILPLLGLGLIGGWLGGYFGSAWLKKEALSRLLSVVLLLASFKLFFA